MKLTESKVNSKIWSTPLYLIIYFDYGKDNENIPKIISFGNSFNLTGFVVKQNIYRNYELFIMNAYDKNSKIKFVIYVKSKERNSWIKFNDSNFDEISFEELFENKQPSFLIYKRMDD